MPSKNTHTHVDLDPTRGGEHVYARTCCYFNLGAKVKWKHVVLSPIARKFTHKDIEAINKIYFLLKEKGYTIQGAEHYINNEKTSDKLDIVNKLKLIKDKLIEIRNQL